MVEVLIPDILLTIFMLALALMVIAEMLEPMAREVRRTLITPAMEVAEEEVFMPMVLINPTMVLLDMPS